MSFRIGFGLMIGVEDVVGGWDEGLITRLRRIVLELRIGLVVTIRVWNKVGEWD